MSTSLSPTVWNDLLGQLRLTRPQLARAWFSQLEPASLEGGVLIVRTANGAQSRYLQQHCLAAFVEAAQAATGRLVSVEFTHPDDEPVTEAWDPDAGHLLNPELTFDNFVTGTCNQLAQAAAIAVARGDGRMYNPLFLHGGVGLGKTHLLQAICHEAGAQRPDIRWRYVPCEVFTNDYIEAFEHGTLPDFRHRYRQTDLLVVDDVQCLAGRERSQEEFFHTFNAISQTGRSLVMAADRNPAEIEGLEERLVSRFRMGLVAPLDSPCVETRISIVRRKASLRCVEASSEVCQAIAERLDGNVRELEGALIKIDAVGHTEGVPLTAQLANRVLGEVLVRIPHVASIVDIVAAKMDVKVADLHGKRRGKSLTLPRHVCMYVTREITSKSFDEIGGLFGGRDHTTVLHAHRTIRDRLREDEQLRSLVDEIIATVRQSAR